MKKLLLLSFCLISFFGKAQITIVEDVYDKENKPVDVNYLKNTHEIVVFKGKKMGGLIAASQVNNIYSYDLEGKKSVIAENEKLYTCAYSTSGNTLRVYDISKGVFKSKEKYFIQNKFTDLYVVDQTYPFSRFFPYTDNLTDKFTLKVKNQKKKEFSDFEKDDFILTATDIITRDQKTYTIEKPSISRLKGDNLIEAKEKLGLNYKLNNDESFSLITKSISKDYSKMTMYRSNYSTNDGKLQSDIAFQINLDNKTLIYSNNGGGFIGTNGNNRAFFDDDLSINNFITDYSNGDVYIYGLYSDKISELNKEANPKGYYVFKFDKNGVIKWKSINSIVEKKINDNYNMLAVQTDLSIINNQLCFYAFVNTNAEFLSYAIIDKDSGNQTKSNNIVFHEKQTVGGMGGNFLYSSLEYEDIKELNNKRFNVKGIISYDLNPKLADYVKSVTNKKNILFSTLFTDIGMLLIETDNDKYYKVTYFKD
ncbi:hypothetical protein [Flavobacterium sp.]|uniref:hypothetical protein n=1 Tax=Flavobacterium sp. TaxID=239 RepID=UPI00374D0015